MTKASAWFIVAAVFGVVHAGFSLYWATGGEVLRWSLGSDLVASFRERLWLLAVIGFGKLLAALAPVVLARWEWPLRYLTRSICWLGAALLIVWGGINTVVGNAVLAGWIRPESGFDRPGMIGHAYLWDPLFLVWGAAMVVGLFLSRARRTSA